MKTQIHKIKCFRVIIYLFLFSFLFQSLLFSQNGTIKGRVYNERNNEPLPFVNLIIYETRIGSTTDFDGNFIFKGLEPGMVRLQVSSVGFEGKITEEFMVTNTRVANIDIGLKEMEFQLDTFVVQASAFQRKKESPVSLRRLASSEIESSPGSNRDISKVIQSLPGVAFTPAYRNDVIIRGGGPNENTFYLDGVEIPNLNHFATQGSSGGPVGIINPDFIREIEMHSSAFPASRGNALSSVFEFQQIQGNSEKFNFRGTVGASDLALTVDGPLTEYTTAIFSVRRSYLQFLFNVIGLPFLPTYNDFQFKTNTSLSENSDLSFIGLGALDQFKLNLSANDTEEQQYFLDYLPVDEQWNYTIGAVYRRFRNNGFDRLVISRNMLRNFSYKYPDNDETQERIYDYVSDEIENKLRFERIIEVDNFRFTLGAGGEYAKYTNDTYREIFRSGNPFVIDYDSSLEMFKWSLFGQVSRSFINNRLSLSFGLRTDANNYSSNMSNPLNQLSPRLSASYSLNEQMSLIAATGRYYQLPAYTTLGFKNNDGILVNKENNLKYINVNHYVGGFEFLPTRQTLISLEGFYKQYGNYPQSVEDGIPISARPIDFGIFGDEEVISDASGRAYGAELLYREQRLEGLNVILSYTFVRSEFEDNENISNDDYIPTSWDNRHIVNLTATQSLKNNWDIGLKWRFSGGSPYTPYDIELSSIRSAWEVNQQGYLDYGRFNSLRLSSFHQLDLRVDKKFFFNNFSLMLYLDVQNVYNFKAEQPAFLVPERDADGNPILITENGTEKYQLKKLQPSTGTILPTIGIMIDF